MKRILLYLGLCIVFLVVVFALNGVYVNMLEKNTSASGATEIDKPAQNPDDFSSYLPIVLIETNGQRILKDDEVFVKIKVLNGSMNTLMDEPILLADATIKYRGNSSYSTFDKKQYRIEFKQSAGNEKNKAYPLLGMQEATDWVLNGPFLDRSLSRNYLGFYLSRQLLPWAPNTQYCEVFIDGEYQGLYLLIEPITNEVGRLNLTDFSLISGACSYVIKMDRVGEEETPIETYGITSGNVRNETSISYPSPANITNLQYEYILNDVSTFEKVLYSDNFADPELGYAKYIDVDTFVDYFVVCETMMLTDAGNLSTYIYKDLNSKLYITTWDFNNAYNNIPWYGKDFDQFYMVDANWFSKLTQDRSFVDKVVNRYTELRKSDLSDETLFNIIDENINYLGDATTRNFVVWGYTFNYLLLNPENGQSRDPKSFEDAIQMLKDAIVKRGEFLDTNIQRLYDYCTN